jgi:hypothetical protein
MTFQVQGVPLIPQDLNMACWYASARMLIEWRQAKVRACEGAHPNPEHVPAIVKQYSGNTGLFPSQISSLAKILGMREVPPSSPTPDAISSWLAAFGPLWFAGCWPSLHATVVTGISSAGIHLNDPWPVNSGKRHIITLDRFAEILQPMNSGANLASNLLYLPG